MRLTPGMRSLMKLSRMSRREMIEECIVRGALVAGVVGISQPHLLARWQQATREAMAATRPEVLGPFFKKGAPNVRVLRASRSRLPSPSYGKGREHPR